ncbi:MAG: hypothetical protein RLZZ74_1412 [Cyanobacteriota bacterium]|jgi:hypothetical protein
MNSEIPSIPESENSETTETTIFESDQSSDALQLDVDEQNSKVTPEVTSDVVDDHDPQLVDQRSPVTVEPESVIDPLEELEELLEFELPTATTTEQTSEDNHDLDDQPVKAAELFVDTWLDESDPLQEDNPVTPSTRDEVEQLKQLKTELQQEIAELKAHKEQLLLHQVREAQENLGRMIEEGTKELRERKTALRIEIEKLERRQERLNQEMRSNFAGSSKELAIRVQGFKEYLVGSLQDLASAADKLELVRTGEPAPRSRERIRDLEDPRREGRESREGRDRDRTRNRDRNLRGNEPARTGTRTGQGNRPAQAQFSEPTFADQSRRIRQLLDKYCNSPDYYGSPWQLRRTFDQTQAKKVQDWFFSQGGRGAIDSTGSRLQNILIASATVSILHDLYRDRTQVLVLTDTPENLGEWRKGLEDCLGISRQDFGTNRGVVLFDSPDILVQRAERLLADKLLPVIIIDETEEQLNLSVLKFPIWLAFASSNKSRSANYLY